ncbi:hypothetical protein GCM10010124_04950 [Pilimelia terevasa]|uniref:DUF6879 domain-containing protein n=1 Tax=Pilimelia terevasa TaxID=53372 RepID=A0A8J3BMY5_9ACTN|nr:DUF6879 family protein [Pilimelia terevasa]GGK15312.1 hypothetical protein GCM10010124_04950 [Pilimelia terevasa]
MRDIDVDSFEACLRGIRIGWRHLELRDSYGVADENEALRAWQRGEEYQLQGLDSLCQFFGDLAARGRVLQRVKVVSEPLSDYQQWSLNVSRRVARSGEEIRVVNRKVVATLLVPPADFYVLDGTRALFLHHDGNGGTGTFSITDDRSVVLRCIDSFSAVWDAAAPLDSYLGPG